MHVAPSGTLTSVTATAPIVPAHCPGAALAPGAGGGAAAFGGGPAVAGALVGAAGGVAGSPSAGAMVVPELMVGGTMGEPDGVGPLAPHPAATRQATPHIATANPVRSPTRELRRRIGLFVAPTVGSQRASWADDLDITLLLHSIVIPMNWLEKHAFKSFVLPGRAIRGQVRSSLDTCDGRHLSQVAPTRGRVMTLREGGIVTPSTTTPDAKEGHSGRAPPLSRTLACRRWDLDHDPRPRGYRGFVAA
jgi:hypothetical protein